MRRLDRMSETRPLVKEGDIKVSLARKKVSRHMYMKRACITDAADADTVTPWCSGAAYRGGGGGRGNAEKEGFGIVLLSFLFE